MIGISVMKDLIFSERKRCLSIKLSILSKKLSQIRESILISSLLLIDKLFKQWFILSSKSVHLVTLFICCQIIHPKQFLMLPDNSFTTVTDAVGIYPNNSQCYWIIILANFYAMTESPPNGY